MFDVHVLFLAILQIEITTHTHTQINRKKTLQNTLKLYLFIRKLEIIVRVKWLEPISALKQAMS